METSNPKPVGITLISLLFFIGSLNNFYSAFTGSGEGFWLQLFGGFFQLFLAVQFNALNKTVFKIVVFLNILGLIASSLFVVKGFVQIFQSDTALLEIAIFLPIAVISAFIALYLKKPRVKNLFNGQILNKSSNKVNSHG